MPILSFQYGLMTSPLQNATITIGPLECITADKQKSSTPRPTSNFYGGNEYVDDPYLPDYDQASPVYYDDFGGFGSGWD